MIALTEIMLVSLPLVSDLPILLGRLNRLLAFNLVDTSLSVLFLAVGCLWGVEGAAASRLVYGAVWLCLYWRFMHGLVQFNTRALIAIYAKSAGATLAAVAPLAITYAFWISPAHISVLELFGVAVAGGAAWLTAMIVLGHPALAEFVALAAGVPVARRFVTHLSPAS